MNNNVLLELNNIEKRFKFHAGLFSPEDKWVYAVNRLSLNIKPGEIYGLVGESGCGKTTAARLIVRMYQPTSGEILYKKNDTFHYMHRLQGKALKQIREDIQYIFQDPARSLNPRMTILDILISGYRYSNNWPGKSKATEEAASLLKEVGLQPEDLWRRPTDFSGGQRQRISIARGLMMNPKLLICDEVVSALDVSIQSQILNLLLKLKEERNLSIIFISHDLSVVSYICDRIGVMYRGVLVEEAPTKTLNNSHIHGYTKHLYGAIPPLTLKKGGYMKDTPYTNLSKDPTLRPKELDNGKYINYGVDHRVLDLDLIS